MKQRTISAIILSIILFGSLFLNSTVFTIVILVTAIIGFNEFFDIKYKDKLKKLRTIKLLGMICLILISLNNIFYSLDIKAVLLFPLIILSVPVVLYNDYELYNITDCLYVIGGIYLLGFAFGNIIYLGNTSISKCIFIFIISFIADTYAYFGGRLIGRHKLTTISPKKTIEGSIVGTVMGVVAGSVYFYNVIGGVSLIQVILFSLILTLLSEIGDLMFSSIKRFFDKKDYSNLIPGHGGILDRFDSVIYVSLGFMLILSML